MNKVKIVNENQIQIPKNYNNTTNDKLPAIEQYFNEIEILNLQALPLQPIYKNKGATIF